MTLPAPSLWPVGKYRLLESAYMAPKPGQTATLLEAGVTITCDGRPGAHMEPLDDAANEAVKRAEAEDARLMALQGWR